jgi:hypothetical protein
METETDIDYEAPLICPRQQRAIKKLIEAARLVVSHGYTQSPAFNYAIDSLSDAVGVALREECDRINEK